MGHGHPEVVGDQIVLGEAVQFRYLDPREAAKRRPEIALYVLASLEAALQTAVSDRVRGVESRHRVIRLLVAGSVEFADGSSRIDVSCSFVLSGVSGRQAGAPRRGASDPGTCSYTRIPGRSPEQFVEPPGLL